MEKVLINNKYYNYVYDYKDFDLLRKSFNSLTQETYGFDFEQWYQNGYWKNRYIPYSLVDDNKIVSNISVNVIDFLINDDIMTCVQIGTVMTSKDYRKKGLNRFLMEKVLDEWKDKCDLLYLFANNSVLEFYPKFGFETVSEYQHSIEIQSENTQIEATRINMSLQENRDFLLTKINNTTLFSKFQMIDNPSLIMFYCTLVMNEYVYYIKEFDAIVIAEYDENVLYLHDIFCEKNIPLNDVILKMSSKAIKKVFLCFTPLDTTNFSESLLEQDESTLFVLEDKLKMFDNNKVMFPTLSMA